MPQGARVFRDLTVAENLRMGGFTLAASLLAERRDAVLASFPVLRERARQRAGALSGVGDKTEAGDLLHRRREIMEAWSAYCASSSDDTHRATADER